MIKAVQKREEYFIEFSEDEFAKFGWEPNQKFDWKLNKDVSVFLKPWTSIDLGDIESFPREVLELLIIESLEKDVPVNQVIIDLLKRNLKKD